MHENHVTRVSSHILVLLTYHFCNLGIFEVKRRNKNYIVICSAAHFLPHSPVKLKETPNTLKGHARKMTMEPLRLQSLPDSLLEFSYTLLVNVKNNTSSGNNQSFTQIYCNTMQIISDFFLSYVDH
jgi:hypothetical protein